MHLCSGYGGFELALRHAGTRTVCHIERDAHAAATLVARMEDQALDQAPIWDDLETFDGAAWSGRVDLITAGFPCQPFSAAGKGLGISDERWLWPHIARIIRDVGPRIIILENVPNFVRLGLAHVLSDLAEMGFSAEWGCLAASAVGAPHRRERVWLYAVADSESGRRVHGEIVAKCGPEPAGGGARTLVHADSLRIEANHEQPFKGTQGQSRVGIRNYAGFPPARNDSEGWRRWLDSGLPGPVFRRGVDGPAHWMDRSTATADRLHLAGNGLVPQCAAVAIHHLAERMKTTRSRMILDTCPPNTIDSR